MPANKWLNKNKQVSQHKYKQKAKPDFTTDFIDRSQYRLSQGQMIQKKAALQSKHRQQARQELQERRRKLEMGIIDEQTRKIYETALTSKNIDINPSIRKNLTEMIKYEKEQKQKNREDQEFYSDNQEDNQFIDQSDKQIKDVQAFIKKFQKAKKQHKIQNAVELLTNEKAKKPKQNKQVFIQQGPKLNNFIKDHTNKGLNEVNEYMEFSQDEAISSIQDTIKFMQQKLFAAKRTVQQHSKSFIHDADQQNYDKNFKKQKQSYNFQKNKTQERAAREYKNQKQIVEHQYDANQVDENQADFNERIAQISQLRIQLKDQNDQSDEQCMDTIRRMRQLMDSQQIQFQTQNHNLSIQGKKMKQNIRDNANPFLSKLQSNKNVLKHFNQNLDSDIQVSFNLTANDDNSYQLEDVPNYSSINKKQISTFKKWQISDKVTNNSKKQQQYQDDYQKIKQNLFNCLGSEPSDQQSNDSFVVNEKINMWRNQLKHQVQPEQEDDEPKQRSMIFLKPTNKNNFQASNSSNKVFKKQNQYVEEDSSEAYKSTYFSDGNNNMIQSSTASTFMKKPPLHKKSSESNVQFDVMRDMISKNLSQIHKIEIQPLKIQSLNQNGGLLGFDFRSGINLKKNLLHK